MSCNNTPKTFDSAILAEFAGGYLSDNALCVLEMAAAEPGTREQLLELAASAKALFLLVTLECRQCDRIRDCAELWGGLWKLYEQAANTWEGVCPASDSQAYLGLLGRLTQIAQARLELYSEEGWERDVLVARKSW
jgi:hypothetical protein